MVSWMDGNCSSRPILGSSSLKKPSVARVALPRRPGDLTLASLPVFLLLPSSPAAAGQAPSGKARVVTAAAGLPVLTRGDPGGKELSLAAVLFGGGWRGLAWRRPASCARGDLAQVEAATGDVLGDAAAHGGGGGLSMPAQILAGGSFGTTTTRLSGA